MVLLVLAKLMLLWLHSCSFWRSQCCGGYTPARFGYANVAVALVLLFWPSQRCCGYPPVCFGQANVAVAMVLFIWVKLTLLWLYYSWFWLRRRCCALVLLILVKPTITDLRVFNAHSNECKQNQ